MALWFSQPEQRSEWRPAWAGREDIHRICGLRTLLRLMVLSVSLGPPVHGENQRPRASTLNRDKWKAPGSPLKIQPCLQAALCRHWGQPSQGPGISPGVWTRQKKEGGRHFCLPTYASPAELTVTDASLFHGILTLCASECLPSPLRAGFLYHSGSLPPVLHV